MINNDLHSLWEQRLEAYEFSGKTIAAWCQEQLVRENQFYYWRKKLRVDQVEKRQAVKWLPLELGNGKLVGLAPDFIAVHVGQVTVEIQKGFDQQLLREIIQVLQII